jgi:hypothetical protein
MKIVTKGIAFGFKIGLLPLAFDAVYFPNGLFHLAFGNVKAPTSFRRLARFASSTPTSDALDNLPVPVDS